MPLLEPDGYRHARRIRLKRKHKYRDRFKAKLGGWMYKRYPKHSDPGYHFRRRRTAPETGYGVAYEYLHDADR